MDIGDRKKVGQKLKVLRTDAGLSYERAAELSNYSVPHIRKIEEGKSSPTLDCLHSLLEKAYGRTADEFFGSLPRRETTAESEIVDELEFLLDEALRPDSNDASKQRALVVNLVIHELYTHAISARTVRRRSKIKESDRKVHGKYLDRMPA